MTYHDNCPECKGKGAPETREALAKAMGFTRMESPWGEYYADDATGLTTHVAAKPEYRWQPDLDDRQMAMVERAVRESIDPSTGFKSDLWDKYCATLRDMVFDDDPDAHPDDTRPVWSHNKSYENIGYVLEIPTCIRARAMAMAKAIGGGS